MAGAHPFPARDQGVFLVYAVVLGTLIVPSLTLEPLVRRLGLGQSERLREQEIEARIRVSRAALERLDELVAAAEDADGGLRHLRTSCACAGWRSAATPRPRPPPRPSTSIGPAGSCWTPNAGPSSRCAPSAGWPRRCWPAWGGTSTSTPPACTAEARPKAPRMPRPGRPTGGGWPPGGPPDWRRMAARHDLHLPDEPTAAPRRPTPPADARLRHHRPRVPRALIGGLLAALVLLGGALYLTRPTTAPAPLPGGAGQAPASGGYRGSLVVPVRAAPATVLSDRHGRRIDLAAYHGRAVLVTFLYTHCPDVCPLIAAHLRAVQAQLGRRRAARVALVAISVDPRGDTRRTVTDFLRAHALTGRMEYLLGSAAELGRVWAAWNVGSQRDAGHPESVAHSALVYGIDAGGRLTTIYPAAFDPADIVNDVPLLAAR